MNQRENGPSNHLPHMQVVGAGAGGGIRAHVHAAIEPRRESATRALALMIGIWPVFAIIAMIFGFAWGFAMFQSP